LKKRQASIQQEPMIIDHKPQAIITTHKSEKEEEDFDPTIFGPDYRSEYLLASDDWKYDTIPEIIDGMNIADYIDPDIMRRLEELEKEEDDQELEYENQMMSQNFPFLNEEEEEQLEAIHDKKKMIMQSHRMNKQTQKNKPQTPRGRGGSVKMADEMKTHLCQLGIDPTQALKRARSRSQSRGDSVEKSTEPPNKRARLASRSRSRSLSAAAAAAAASTSLAPSSALLNTPALASNLFCKSSKR